ncbi:MAG: alpha/beta fold hydrolase [Deltaproteobacteria bacterium]|nr:alpha/beta fold hydrolase [Deltaproteobacteria bacterium]
MPKVSVNGVSLYYEESGAGPETIVFSHGLFWSGRMFEAQRAALSREYRCIAFDHRGQGQSEITQRGYGIDEIWLDAVALIEALKLGPVHWAGLSMGGFVGMRIAARRPELIRSLMLLNTAADKEPLLNRPRYAVLGFLAKFVGLRPFMGEATRKMFGKTFRADASRAARLHELREFMSNNDPRGAIPALMGVAFREDVLSELARIQCPTMMLIGEEDAAVVPARGRRTAALIRGCETVVIPRAGHSSSMEEPEAVTQALAAFLHKHRGAR